MQLKDEFSAFLSSNTQRFHFAAHSHHPWPDCSFDGQKQYWLDSTKHADLKWEEVIFPDIIPAVQGHIARILNFSDASRIAFAPNTHEFVLRLLSCLPHGTNRPARILTTNGEFHSFSRQIKRSKEAGLLDVDYIDVHPTDSFESRFIDAIRTAEDKKNAPYDLIFLSHVFFNSGYVTQDLARIIDSVKHDETLICVDGYHAFMALPVDMRPFENRIFYISGGYKYAMAGEGCCFIHVPDGYALRPVNTGWYAEFGALGDKKGDIPAYAADGMRFMGATFDPSGLYRMKSVFDMLRAKGIEVSDIHEYVMDLQDYFLEKLDRLNSLRLNRSHLMVKDAAKRGHFLTFQTDEAALLQRLLQEHNIITDCRDDRLRFGFGVYQDKDLIDRLMIWLKDIL